MDKPAIVEVKQKGGGASQPEERGGTPVAEEQQKEAGELETKKNPWQPDEGLSELEQSVLEEMRKRGEITQEEEKKIVEEVRQEEKKDGGQPNLHEITVASEEPKPRVVEEHDYSLVAQPPRKQALIKQELVGGVVIREESTLEKEKHEQASRDILPLEAGPGVPVADERQRAAELAERIWKQKQAEKSWFNRVKNFLGFGGAGAAGGGFA